LDAWLCLWQDLTVDDEPRNASGLTELHRAAYEGELDWVVACIAGGMNVDARSHNGWTPLHWAVDMGCVGTREERIAVVRALIDAGADLGAVALDGRTIEDLARDSTSEYLIPHLRRRAGPNDG
jgi:ankyrin repeat protein